MANLTITDFLTARLDHAELVTYNPALMRVGGPGLSELVKRARADIAAKRRILADYQTAEANAHFPNFDGGVAEGLKTAVCHLASAYADHPDYNPDWRP